MCYSFTIVTGDRCIWCEPWNHFISDAKGMNYGHDEYIKYICMASHNQKGDVTSQFDCLDLRNAMVLLMIPQASCDASAGISGVT